MLFVFLLGILAPLKANQGLEYTKEGDLEPARDFDAECISLRHPNIRLVSRIMISIICYHLESLGYCESVRHIGYGNGLVNRKGREGVSIADSQPTPKKMVPKVLQNNLIKSNYS